MVSVKEVPQIGDRIYTDFRECCEDQKVSYRWVCNKMLQEGVSVQDAVRYYKRKQEKKLQKAQKQVPVKGKMLEPQPVNVLGKKYESKEKKYRRKKGAVAAELSEKDAELFESLRELRREIASEEKVPPYMVFADKTLAGMCVMRPATRDEMLEVSGVGEHKLEKYGDRFLEILRKG